MNLKYSLSALFPISVFSKTKEDAEYESIKLSISVSIASLSIFDDTCVHKREAIIKKLQTWINENLCDSWILAWDDIKAVQYCDLNNKKYFVSHEANIFFLSKVLLLHFNSLLKSFDSRVLKIKFSYENQSVSLIDAP